MVEPCLAKQFKELNDGKTRAQANILSQSNLIIDIQAVVIKGIYSLDAKKLIILMKKLKHKLRKLIEEKRKGLIN